MAPSVDGRDIQRKNPNNKRKSQDQQLATSSKLLKSNSADATASQRGKAVRSRPKTHESDTQDVYLIGNGDVVAEGTRSEDESNPVPEGVGPKRPATIPLLPGPSYIKVSDMPDAEIAGTCLSEDKSEMDPSSCVTLRIELNGQFLDSVKAFVDMGSDCNTIRASKARKYGWPGPSDEMKMFLGRKDLTLPCQHNGNPLKPAGLSALNCVVEETGQELENVLVHIVSDGSVSTGILIGAKTAREYNLWKIATNGNCDDAD